MMENIFTKHPSQVNQTYSTHWAFALRNSFKLLLWGGLLFVHAFLPCLFQNNSRDGIIRLAKSFTERMQSRQA